MSSAINHEVAFPRERNGTAPNSTDARRTDNRNYYKKAHPTLQAPPGYTDDDRSKPLVYMHQHLNADTDLLLTGTNVSETTTDASSKLASVWSDDLGSLPEFSLPNTYYIGKPILKLTQFQKFKVPTLIHIFYSSPKEFYQTLAATELYKREWSFDRSTMKWFNGSRLGWTMFDVESWTEVEASPPTSVLRLEEIIPKKLVV